MKKKVCLIEGYEDFTGYMVDSRGHVISTKRKSNKILSCYWTHNNYKATHLYDSQRRRKRFYIHRLVAEAFLPNPMNCWGVTHKNKNRDDNNIDNLEWLSTRVKHDDGTISKNTDSLILSPDISNYIKLVHRACLEKGVPVPNEYDFYHTMIETSLDEYINRYGLKKIIHQITHSNQ